MSQLWLYFLHDAGVKIYEFRWTAVMEGGRKGDEALGSVGGGLAFFARYSTRMLETDF